MSGAAMLSDGVIKAFAAGVKGQVLRPGEDGYDAARQVWNGMIDKRPALVARCAAAEDVVAAVNLARDHGLLLAVRGGGHSASGTGVCDGGLLIDLSGMKAIRVDAAARTAQAEGGATWGDLDRETQAFGLATPGGVVSTTGIAGLTLGGGVGWLVRKYGLACDNLLSVDIVTADGRLRTASATEHPDLFWAVRGGGGNFGVVTRFEYRLHPVGPQVLAGLLIHPRARAPEMLKFWRDFTRTAPEDLATYAALAHAPDGTPVAIIIVCYHGPLAEGEAVIRPLREFGPPLQDAVQPMPYVEFQTALNGTGPAGKRAYWKSSFLRAPLDDAALDTVVEHAMALPAPLSATILEFYGGAVNRVPAGATAYPHRDAVYLLNILTLWDEAGADDANIRWVRGLFDA
ncbi:MAG TPA: FAD-binding oxidoreductase, partial [Candidatus Binatia bacterium]|nr:FAD-binding oxidoreductase [Candidatus Binatia bacterium]